MLINEGGLIRAIKRAYKAGGYTVLNTGNDVAIYTDRWFAMANRALLPRKVLATIVEHMGMIPERDMPTGSELCQRRSGQRSGRRSFSRNHGGGAGEDWNH